MGDETRPKNEVTDEEAIKPIEDQSIHMNGTMGRTDVAIDATRPAEARRKKRQPSVYWPEKVVKQGRDGYIGDCRHWIADCEQPRAPLSVERNQRRYDIKQIEGAGEPGPGRGRNL